MFQTELTGLGVGVHPVPDTSWEGSRSGGKPERQQGALTEAT